MIGISILIFIILTLFLSIYRSEQRKRNDSLYYAFRDYLYHTNIDFTRYKANIKFENFGDKIIIWIEDK
ncbi:hypothetical protein GM3709_2323 [Geminocystis sp. NIES-3709]|nr:hypothetical protein GM3709_2323 [Geminocystis sp. NIES-3709]